MRIIIKLSVLMIFLSVAVAGFTNTVHASMQHNDGKILSLGGEWEFYWNELLYPNDIAENNTNPTYIVVPGSWRNKEISNSQLSQLGYGTYRTTFLIPQDQVGRHCALSLYYIGSAYRIWINGNEYPGLGVVGTTKHEEIPQLQRNLIMFEPKEQQIEVVIQVSNFSFREGGIIDEISFGESDVLIRSILIETFIMLLIVGASFIIGIYHLIVYLLRRNQLAILYIGLFSLAISLRTFILTEYVANMMFPFLSWETATKMEYLLEVVALLLVVLLMKQMFSEETPIVIARVCYVIATVTAVVIILTPSEVYTLLLPYHPTILIALLVYMLVSVTIKAKLHRREGANLNLIGTLLFVAAVINDIMNSLLVIRTFYMMEYAFVVFILFQAVIISSRYERINKQNERLTDKLIVWNNSLEERIAERTKDLIIKNNELEEMQQARTRILANIAHDIGTPLAGVRTYLQILKEGKIKTDKNLIFTQLIDKLSYIQHLNNDLLELSKLESKQLPFHMEELQMKVFFMDMHQAMELEVCTENVTLHLGRMKGDVNGREVWILADSLRLKQVMQNYIHNAITHNDASEKRITMHYDVRSTEKGYEVVIEVEDNGLGILATDLPYIFEQFYRKADENTEGSGLGLAIVKEIIEQHGGQVGAVAKEEGGSIFYFTLGAYVK